MSDIKWSAFPLAGTLAAGDTLVGIRAGANVRLSLTFPWSPTLGGTGVTNLAGSTLTLGGALTTAGAFVSTFTMTGATNVTFPTSGTLATTASAAGIVNTGSTNQLAYYAAAGTTLSGLAIVNSAILTTTAGGVPTWVASTGSGAPVRATSPTLTTPVLGAASATSINFGGTSLSAYAEGTFTPTFTLATAGDLSVVYTVQNGFYTRIGRVCFVQYDMAFTPTFTTGSGTLRFAGLPFTTTLASTSSAIYQTSVGFTWPVGTTSISAVTDASSTFAFLRMNGSTLPGQSMTSANIVSGVAIRVIFSMTFTV